MATKKATWARPLADRVVIRPLEADNVTKGGIHLPDMAKKKPERGEVLEVGIGGRLQDGTRFAMEVSVGDIVAFTQYAGDKVEIEGEELRIVRECEILAVLSEGE